MRSFLKAGVVLAVFVFQQNTAHAQGALPAPTQLMSIEVNGVRSRSYGALDVDGSPFLNDDWVIGTATNSKGENFQLNLKYDVVTDQLVFADKDGGMMLFTEPITHFTLGEAVFQNGYPAADRWTKTTFYKVIGTGKSKILVHYYKKKLEVRDTGGITGYKLEDNIDHYLLKDDKMTVVKLNKGSILAALADKKTELENYLKTHKTDLKKEADLAGMIDYYNSL